MRPQVFAASLDLLMKKMMPCEPHFVRCIKPNKQNAPKMWEVTYVTEQLKYTGMLETIRIRREGIRGLCLVLTLSALLRFMPPRTRTRSVQCPF